MSLNSRTAAGGLARLKQRVKQSAKQILGRLLLPLRPDLRRRIEARNLERYRSHFRDAPLAERLVLAALLARHNASGTQSAVAESHRRYWESADALKHHISLETRISHVSGGQHHALIVALDQVVAGDRYHALCEIGCGSGLVLDYLGRRWPNLQGLIGLDLSSEQVASNRNRFSEPRLRFDAADASVWISAHAEAGTIFVTYDGVLEHFTEPALETLLRTLAARTPVCFALIEPIAPDYDLDREEHSRLDGGEMSFSHNYPRAFAKAGFHIRWLQELPKGRYLMLIATAGDDSTYAFGATPNDGVNNVALPPTKN